MSTSQANSASPQGPLKYLTLKGPQITNYFAVAIRVQDFLVSVYGFSRMRVTEIKVTGLDSNLLPSNIYFKGHYFMLIEGKTPITGTFQRAMDKQRKTPRFLLTELCTYIDEFELEEHEDALEIYVNRTEVLAQGRNEF
jgi:hypothetical protein